MAMAVVWEFYELISDTYFFTHSQLSNADTMNDLIMGGVGALFFCLFGFCADCRKTSEVSNLFILTQAVSYVRLSWTRVLTYLLMYGLTRRMIK